MLKKLFYASASILMLALAYHLGVTEARGQERQQHGIVVAAQGNLCALTADGRVYLNTTAARGIGNEYDLPSWALRDTVGPLSAPPVSVAYVSRGWHGEDGYIIDVITADGNQFRKGVVARRRSMGRPVTRRTELIGSLFR